MKNFSVSRKLFSPSSSSGSNRREHRGQSCGGPSTQAYRPDDERPLIHARDVAQAQRQESHFRKLPPELRQMIFDNLDRKGLENASMVCRLFLDDVRSVQSRRPRLKEAARDRSREHGICADIIADLDFHSPVPDTAEARKLIEDFRQMSDAKLRNFLLPFYNTRCMARGITQVLWSRLARREATLTLKVNIATREYITRGKNLGGLGGKAG